MAVEHATVMAKVNQERIQNDRIYKCNGRGEPEFNPDDAFYFFPVKVGSLSS